MEKLYIGKVVDEPFDWVIGELLQQGEKEEDYYIRQLRDDFPWSVYCGFGVFQVEPGSVQPISEEAVKGLVFGCGFREKMRVKYKQLDKAWEDIIGDGAVQSKPDKAEERKMIKPDSGEKVQLIKRIEQLEAQKEFLLTVLHKSILLPFTVMDKEKGKEADTSAIAAKEEWAKGLCYCDMEGFAVTEDGRLVLLDECGRYEFCPGDRFEVVSSGNERQIIERIEQAEDVPVKREIRFSLDEKAFHPSRAHKQDAGLDLRARHSGIVPARGSKVFDTGVHVEIPEGYVGFLKSKSGLNVKHNITSEGVIDSGYTGSIIVKLYNHGDDSYTVEAGDKITQLVILPCWGGDFKEVDKLGQSERGDKGFGSTGR